MIGPQIALSSALRNEMRANQIDMTTEYHKCIVMQSSVSCRVTYTLIPITYPNFKIYYQLQILVKDTHPK